MLIIYTNLRRVEFGISFLKFFCSLCCKRNVVGAFFILESLFSEKLLREFMNRSSKKDVQI